MARRFYPMAVTLMGGLGLGLALTYFLGVIFSFLPGWEAWADWFVPRALYLLIVPYVLLVVHLVLRNHVGRFLLKRGAYEEAVEYARKRLKSSVLRSRREVANQRLVYARGLVGLGKYDEARKVLSGHEDELPGPYPVEAKRWLFELALRKRDLDEAEALVEDDRSEQKSAGGELAALFACEAELALRRGDVDTYKGRLMDANWEKASHPRVGLCRALAMIEFEKEGEESDEVLALLEMAAGPVAKEVPARGAELKALRALVLWRRGRNREAQRLLEQARVGPTDAWTEEIIEEVSAAVSE